MYSSLPARVCIIDDTMMSSCTLGSCLGAECSLKFTITLLLSGCEKAESLV